jgi:hypothetical protein
MRRREVGLSTAPAVLKQGYVIVGYVTSTDGTSATAQAGGVLVLNGSGGAVANLTNPSLLDGPWDMTVAASGHTAKIFVSDVLSGTVSRFDVKLTSSGGFQVQRSVQIASGYTHRGDPTAFEIGPTGLVFNAKSNTLYVASTGDNAIYAIRGAGTTKADRGTGKIIDQNSKHLHGPIPHGMPGPQDHRRRAPPGGWTLRRRLPRPPRDGGGRTGSG